ncbi:hypothetical protein COO60DRAFT_1706445 [Scenedesmus sp. NREL 46B-D3]|nr:hypothetical protein COO60DRAFT_1706445 [Scenedesmus sp. NREL 46B-D3]
MTGTTDGDSLEAELQRLASPDLLVAAEAETPKCDMCLQPAVLTYHKTANPNVDDWQSTLDVCGSCFRTIQREGGLVQAPYLSNEKQRQVHALILDKQCTWREYRSKRLHDFGCHQLRFVAQLARSHAASIAAPCSASLEQDVPCIINAGPVALTGPSALPPLKAGMGVWRQEHQQQPKLGDDSSSQQAGDAACCTPAAGDMARRIRCSFKEAEVDVVVKGKGKVKVNASED